MAAATRPAGLEMRRRDVRGGDLRGGGWSAVPSSRDRLVAPRHPAWELPNPSTLPPPKRSRTRGIARRSPAACARPRPCDSRVATARAPDGKGDAPDSGFALQRFSLVTPDRSEFDDTIANIGDCSHSRSAAVLSQESRKVAQILARPVRPAPTLLGAPDTCATNDQTHRQPPMPRKRRQPIRRSATRAQWPAPWLAAVRWSALFGCLFMSSTSHPSMLGQAPAAPNS